MPSKAVEKFLENWRKKRERLRKKKVEKTEQVENLTDYISFVEKTCKEEGVFFRGQQQNWPLLPKIARLKLKQRLRVAEYDMIKHLQRTGHPYVGHVQFYNKKQEICIEYLTFAQHNGMAI